MKIKNLLEMKNYFYTFFFNDLSTVLDLIQTKKVLYIKQTSPS